MPLSDENATEPETISLTEDLMHEHGVLNRILLIREAVLSNFSLVNSLRQGGYILYARHAEATEGIDQPYLNFQNCSTQRNLSEEGRRQAIIYGELLRSLRIPLELPISAGPFCRTQETAALAFGWENVQVNPFWYQIYRLSGDLNPIEQEWILSSLKSILEIQPSPGSNTVIIAHSFPKEIGLGEIPDMGTIVVKPYGVGKGYEVVTQVSLEELNIKNF
ncbi:histidine phosphatase family protein [Paenibacillus sp. S33]|uniref:histidine phosphatase family protein n=1 Tax=Paenibacillus TaxID=44249 RepID=UPI0020B729C7|nr:MULTISPECIES: histidine phosphatase family protein [Paenibacillus]MCP3794025.1 histidine phosphatase family protein [Paenibacillus sp. CH40]MDY7990959.1 histidine phosphatase family protein [Paenibacillus polymyxa]MDY8120166.1 histidine phosphatase family protein [Paenibacillus polymyxa]